MKIGITAGDPAGIGLEVILRSLPSLLSEADWVLYVTRPDFEAHMDRYPTSFEWAAGDSDSDPAAGVLHVVMVEESGEPVSPGDAGPESGRRARVALDCGAHAALAGTLDGLVTAPLGKRWVGPGFHGHTDYLAELAGVRMAIMSFFTPTFKVVLATAHVSLREALASLSVERYCDLLQLTAIELGRCGMVRPRIAVAAINPHAGEGGMFGDEDEAILVPAVEAARKAGLDVSGPHSADSLYHRAHSGEFDVVVAPYHDQGLIPVKLIAPRRAANVTLGLPYVRTSPDHGTAFEIAGRGVADHAGMETAMRWAVELGGLRDEAVGRRE